MKRIYLDHAAATPLDPRVKKAMEPFWCSYFGNAGGLYEEGRTAKLAVDNAREKIAKIIGARSEEIIFTSGGTESDNLAVFGVARGAPMRSKNSLTPLRTRSELNSATARPRLKFSSRTGVPHIITTTFEHHAVLTPCERLEKDGFDVTYLDVGSDGVVDPEVVRKELRTETILVSVMYANNEIGTIQPISEIGKIIKEYRQEKTKILTTDYQHSTTNYPYFHTDACQAAGYLELNIQRLGVDLMTVNAAKMYGPKGVGFLYKRRGVALKAQIIGGGQEMRMRSGTESVPLIVGLASALEIAQETRKEESARLTEIRDYFISQVYKNITKVVLNGHPVKRLPNNINVSILDIEGEALILYLDAKGIALSTGSACTSESLDPSHVILALGRPYEFAHSSMRFTLGRSTTKKDIDYVLRELRPIVERLRAISPLNLQVDAKGMSHPEAFAGIGLKVKAKSKSYK